MQACNASLPSFDKAMINFANESIAILAMQLWASGAPEGATGFRKDYAARGDLLAAQHFTGRPAALWCVLFICLPG